MCVGLSAQPAGHSLPTALSMAPILGWGGPRSCLVTGRVSLQFVSVLDCLSQGTIPWETGLPEAFGRETLAGDLECHLLCGVSWAVLWGDSHSVSSWPRTHKLLEEQLVLAGAVGV